MGLITQIKQMLSKRREEPKTDIENDIEFYRRQQRQQMKVDTIMQHEKNSFLYGEHQNEKT